MCGELSGKSKIADAFPFGVDFYRLNEGDAGEKFDIHNISSRIRSESVTFILNRDEESVKEHPDRIASITASEENRHVVVLGAVPSTEIKGMIVHASDETQRKQQVDTLSRELVQQGFYAPIVSEAGELLFTPDQYDALKDEINKEEQVNRQESSDAPQERQVRGPIPPWEREASAEDSFSFML